MGKRCELEWDEPRNFRPGHWTGFTDSIRCLACGEGIYLFDTNFVGLGYLDCNMLDHYGFNEGRYPPLSMPLGRGVSELRSKKNPLSNSFV